MENTLRSNGMVLWDPCGKEKVGGTQPLTCVRHLSGATLLPPFIGYRPRSHHGSPLPAFSLDSRVWPTPLPSALILVASGSDIMILLSDPVNACVGRGGEDWVAPEHGAPCLLYQEEDSLLSASPCQAISFLSLAPSDTGEER